ncbi:MAG: sialidase family protein [Pseudobacter sp.]|uniref:sialidase family protein n=1 Tax=Pseudobacter sp. TaxID=2045420 RepID=UPI003F7D003A
MKQTFSSILQLISCCLIAINIIACTAKENNLGPAVTAPRPGNSLPTDSLYIFKERSDGYRCYRIPAIIKAKDGTLLAFAEARKNGCGDEGDIDLVVKRSTDGGKTWGPLIKVWDDGVNTCGNPAPVVDQATGRIVMLMTWNHGEDHISEIGDGTSIDTRRVYLTHSDDNGVTWTTATEITATVKRPEWGWYATGPCHGIQIQSGAHAGRMIIPCDFIEKKANGGRGYSHVVISDDKGATWRIGGISPNDRANESTITELSDGKLQLNMRASGATARLVAVSSDGGETFTGMKTDYALVEPVCQGSLTSGNANGNFGVFFSNPASTTRVNMTIKWSSDNGNTWGKYYRVHAGPSAYSDLVMLSGTHIGILYEGGTTTPYQGIAFRQVAFDEFIKQ